MLYGILVGAGILMDLTYLVGGAAVSWLAVGFAIVQLGLKLAVRLGPSPHRRSPSCLSQSPHRQARTYCVYTACTGLRRFACTGLYARCTCTPHAQVCIPGHHTPHRLSLSRLSPSPCVHCVCTACTGLLYAACTLHMHIAACTGLHPGRQDARPGP